MKRLILYFGIQAASGFVVGLVLGLNGVPLLPTLCLALALSVTITLAVRKAVF